MVTAIKCIDGKKHNWKDMSFDSVGYVEHIIKWCSKCGCTTEFYKMSGTNCLKYRRCIDDKTKTYYIEIPKYLKRKEIMLEDERLKEYDNWQFPPPPVSSNFWSVQNWIDYIKKHGISPERQKEREEAMRKAFNGDN